MHRYIKRCELTPFLFKEQIFRVLISKNECRAQSSGKPLLVLVSSDPIFKMCVIKPSHILILGVDIVKCILLQDLGEPTHTLVPCWMPKTLASKEQVYGLFRPSTLT